MIELITGKYNYWIYIALMMIGFYAMIKKGNLIKKIIGLNIFQTAVFLFYISISKVEGGTVPILILGEVSTVYVNPLPHVLILTAIVVGVSVTAVAIALVIRIYESFGTVEEEEILKIMKNSSLEPEENIKT